MRTFLLLVGYIILWFLTKGLVGWLPWEKLPTHFAGDLLWLLGQYTWVPVVWLVISAGFTAGCLAMLEDVGRTKQGKYFDEVIPRTPKDWLAYHQALLICGAREDWALSSVDAEYSLLEQKLADEKARAHQEEVELRIKALKEIKDVDQ